MNTWDHLDQEQQHRKRHRWIIGIILLVVILGCCGGLLALNTNRQKEASRIQFQIYADTQSQIDRLPDSNNATSSATSFVLQNSLPVSNPANWDLTARAEKADYAVLQNTAIPEFVRLSHPRINPGPMQIRYGDREHTVGVATITKPSLRGAAGEWVARVWFRPAWLPDTVDCGQRGTTAIAGHVSWYGRPGPFDNLGTLSIGESIECLDSDGDWHIYQVVEAVRIPYEDTSYYWQLPNPGEGSVLSLYSCTPELDGIIVVRALLVDNNTEPENPTISTNLFN